MPAPSSAPSSLDADALAVADGAAGSARGRPRGRRRRCGPRPGRRPGRGRTAGRGDRIVQLGTSAAKRASSHSGSRQLAGRGDEQAFGDRPPASSVARRNRPRLASAIFDHLPVLGRRQQRPAEDDAVGRRLRPAQVIDPATGGGAAGPIDQAGRPHPPARDRNPSQPSASRSTATGVCFSSGWPETGSTAGLASRPTAQSAVKASVQCIGRKAWPGAWSGVIRRPGQRAAPARSSSRARAPSARPWRRASSGWISTHGSGAWRPGAAPRRCGSWCATGRAPGRC